MKLNQLIRNSTFHLMFLGLAFFGSISVAQTPLAPTSNVGLTQVPKGSVVTLPLDPVLVNAKDKTLSLGSDDTIACSLNFAGSLSNRTFPGGLLSIQVGDVTVGYEEPYRFTGSYTLDGKPVDLVLNCESLDCSWGGCNGLTKAQFRDYLTRRNGTLVESPTVPW